MNPLLAERPSLKGPVSVSAGYAFRGAVDALPPGDIGVVQMRDIDDKGVDWRSLAYVRLPSSGHSATLASGDVLFMTRGTRNFALMLDHVPVTAVCSPHFFILRVRDPARLHPGFLAWQLMRRPAQEYFQRVAEGSYILNINRTAIENLPLVIPPIGQQLEILAIEQNLRHQRALLNALIDNTNRQAEAIATRLHQQGSPA